MPTKYKNQPSTHTPPIGVAATAEMSINEHVEFLRSILASSTEYAIFAIGLDGNILAWNEGGRQIYGYEAENIIGENIFLLHDTSDVKNNKIQAILDEVCRTGKWMGELSQVRKNSEKFSAFVTITLRQDPEHKPLGFTMISRDMTEQKKLEEKILKINQDLEQFAYIVSHDLKSPLRAIESIATWLEEDNKDTLGEESKKNLALLHQRVKRMFNLINGILQYSIVGNINMEISNVDTKLLLQEVIDNLNPPKTFTIQYADNLPQLLTPKLPLSQVFSNLIGNGIKHHHLQTGMIKIGVQDKGSFYEFSITDNGPGIEPEYHDKIFQLFHTLKSKDSLESTGIGLSIVKKIIDSVGGKITVDSVKNKGTTFCFTWPKVIEPEQP